MRNLYKRISLTKLILMILIFGFLYSGRPWDEFHQHNPMESDLVRLGPMEIEAIRGRNASVRFYFNDRSQPGFLVASYSFNRELDVFSVIRDQRNQGKAKAYLWIYSKDGRTSLWRIDIGEVNVLSFDEAKKNEKGEERQRKRENFIAVIFTLFLIMSFVRWGELKQRWRHHDR